MALFIKREIETLQAENNSLKARIAVYEVRLSAQERTISELRGKIEKLDSQADEYRKIINKHKTDAARSISLYDEVDKIYQGYCREVSRLESEMSRLQTRPHNERGAGRKRRATPEQIELILSLHADGYSQVRIAQILSGKLGKKWNKRTVRNMILAAKN